MTPRTDEPARRRGRVLAHQCPFCHAHWALQTIRHPSAVVIYCRHCSRVRRASRTAPAASR